jgi:hypothetical protein
MARTSAGLVVSDPGTASMSFVDVLTCRQRHGQSVPVGGAHEREHAMGLLLCHIPGIEVDPQRCLFGSRKSDFALQAVVECRKLEPEGFRVVVLR